MQSATCSIRSYNTGKDISEVHCAFGVSVPSIVEPHVQIEIEYKLGGGTYIRMTGADLVILYNYLKEVFKDGKR